MVWARNAAGSVKFVHRDRHRDDMAMARLLLRLLDHGL
jgi:hypothetical protein